MPLNPVVSLASNFTVILVCAIVGALVFLGMSVWGRRK
jgi:hypothetical protein